jgi:multiple RNA-binding domain-containing protein 1
VQVAGAGHTRVCVKGLPKHLTNERLRKHFEDMAEVTDARVCTRSDGASRNFGFVGFRTEKDAQKHANSDKSALYWRYK